MLGIPPNNYTTPNYSPSLGEDKCASQESQDSDCEELFSRVFGDDEDPFLFGMSNGAVSSRPPVIGVWKTFFGSNSSSAEN